MIKLLQTIYLLLLMVGIDNIYAMNNYDDNECFFADLLKNYQQFFQEETPSNINRAVGESLPINELICRGKFFTLHNHTDLKQEVELKCTYPSAQTLAISLLLLPNSSRSVISAQPTKLIKINHSNTDYMVQEDYILESDSHYVLMNFNGIVIFKLPEDGFNLTKINKQDVWILNNEMSEQIIQQQSLPS